MQMMLSLSWKQICLKVLISWSSRFLMTSNPQEKKNLIFERFSRQNKYGIFGNTNIQETRSHGSNIQRQLTLLQEQTNTIKPKKTVCHTLSHQNALI